MNQKNWKAQLVAQCLAAGLVIGLVMAKTMPVKNAMSNGRLTMSRTSGRQGEGFLISLGIFTKFASAWMTEDGEGGHYARFYLQSLARRCSPKGHRVKQCLRVISPMKTSAEVRIRGQEKKRASYGNLIVCASIWACPICAARISEQRKRELEIAIRRAPLKGYKAIMVTYTFSHKLKQPLIDVLAVLKGARRRFKSGRKWQALQSEYDVLGTIAATEVTWGVNGWHPHVHEIIFVGKEVIGRDSGQFEEKLKKHWIAALTAYGVYGVKDIALKVSQSDQYIADYIAKFGREPKDNGNWDMSKEVSKAPVKKARDENHATPLELLIAYGNKSNLAAQLWYEYVIAFKGKKQIIWSNGLKAYFGIGEVTDDELAIDEIEPYDVMANIDADIWSFLIKEDTNGMVRAEILKIAQNEGLEAMQNYIALVTENYNPDEAIDVESIIERLTLPLL